MRVCRFVHVYVCLFVTACVCQFVSRCECVSLCVYVCVCVYMCVSVYVCVSTFFASVYLGLCDCMFLSICLSFVPFCRYINLGYGDGHKAKEKE